jgi:hypothetical protein
MTRTEDRLTDALGASAHTVREDTLHPPVIPPHRDRRWARWLVPASAAAAVALVAVLVAALTGQAAGHRPAGTGTAGPPHYYVDIGNQNQVVVRSTATGAVTATVPIRSSRSFGDGAVTAAADGTFFVASFTSQTDEQIYHFGLTAAGRVTGLAPVPGGRFTEQVNAMAASRDGSRLAVTVDYFPGGISVSSGAVSQPGSTHKASGASNRPASLPTYRSLARIIVIDLRTGSHSVWQGGLNKPGFADFDINSLSWTTDQQLVFTGQWCWPFSVNAQACEAAAHGDRRVAEVREISTAPAGGQLDSGRLLLRQSARYPYIASAVISPDGQTITALVMHGSLEHQAPGTVPRQLSAVQISASSGRQLRVLYQRPLGPTGFWTLSPDSTGTHWLLDGADSYGNGDGPPNQMNLGYNGWISGGRLIPLRPVTGSTFGEAW